MGLLDIETVFRNEKKRTRVSGKFKNISGIFSVLSGKQFSGYEIHMGESYGIKNSILEFSDGSTGGDSHDNIYGCYVHGIFDETELQKVLCAVFTMPKDWSILEKVLTERLTKNNSMIFLQMK